VKVLAQTATEEQTVYRAAWTDYRKRWGVYWLAIASITLFAPLYLTWPSPTMLKWLGCAWAIVIVAANMHLSQFRCPRCRAYFIGRWNTRDNHPSYCHSCGLRKYALDSTEGGNLTGL